jgi:hypothetical protein
MKGCLAPSKSKWYSFVACKDMKTLFTITFTIFTFLGFSQESTTDFADREIPLERELFTMHMPLILVTEKVTKTVSTDGHDGGSAYYINVGEFDHLASRVVFFTRGIHSYAMTSEQLERLGVDNYLQLTEAKNFGATTEYNLHSVTTTGEEIGIAATVLNNTEKDDGPVLQKLNVLEMSEQ